MSTDRRSTEQQLRDGIGAGELRPRADATVGASSAADGLESRTGRPRRKLGLDESRPRPHFGIITLLREKRSKKNARRGETTTSDLLWCPESACPPDL